jgi:hypothetical protein
LEAGTCGTWGTAAPAGVNAATDYVLAQPDTFGVTVTGRLEAQIPGYPGPTVWVNVCNGHPYTATISGTYRYLILR